MRKRNKQIKGNYVYVMSADKNNCAPCKIGRSSDLAKRRQAMQTYHHQRVRIHSKIKCLKHSRCKRLELLVHMELSEFRIRGEWFNLTPCEAEVRIKECANKYRHLSIEDMDKVLLKGEAVSV